MRKGERFVIKEQFIQGGFARVRVIRGDAGREVARLPVSSMMEDDGPVLAAAPELVEAVEALLANPMDPKTVEDAGHLLTRLVPRKAVPK